MDDFSCFQTKECYSNIWTISWQPLESSSSSKMVAAGTGMGTIHYFGLESSGGSPSWKDEGVVMAHQDVVSGLAWRPDGVFILSSSLDNSVRLWCAHSLHAFKE